MSDGYWSFVILETKIKIEDTYRSIIDKRTDSYWM